MIPTFEFILTIITELPNVELVIIDAVALELTV